MRLLKDYHTIGVKWSGTLGLASTQDRLTALRRQQAIARYINYSYHVCVDIVQYVFWLLLSLVS